MTKAWWRQFGHVLRHCFSFKTPSHCAVRISRHGPVETFVQKLFYFVPRCDFLGCTCGKIFWQRPGTEKDNEGVLMFVGEERRKRWEQEQKRKDQTNG